MYLRELGGELTGLLLGLDLGFLRLLEVGYGALQLKL